MGKFSLPSTSIPYTSQLLRTAERECLAQSTTTGETLTPGSASLMQQSVGLGTESARQASASEETLLGPSPPSPVPTAFRPVPTEFGPSTPGFVTTPRFEKAALYSTPSTVARVVSGEGDALWSAMSAFERMSSAPARPMPQLKQA